MARGLPAPREDVGLGHGIVMGLEVSTREEQRRLASAIEICQHRTPLILDEDGVYTDDLPTIVFSSV